MAVITAVTIVVLSSNTPSGKKSSIRTYSEIIESGTLKASIEYNSIDYHVDKDTITGFYYQLIHALAQDMGLELKLSPVMSLSEQIEGLQTGKFDLIASGLPVTSQMRDSILFTKPIIRNKLILVQRKPEMGTDSLLIRNQLDLAGKTVYVTADSPALIRIDNLSNEIGSPIHIKEVGKYGQEQLISLVAHQDIDFTICEESIAKALTDSFPTLDFNTPISFTQLYSWAAHRQSAQLVDTINQWIDTFIKTREFQMLRQQYFKK